MQFSVKSVTKDIARQLSRDAKKVLPAALSRTLNEIAKKATTQLRRNISKTTGLQQKSFKDKMFIRKATRYSFTASVGVSARPANLIRYAAKQNTRGVSVKTGRGRRTRRGAFIANKGRTVFIRTSRKRLPIKALWGPSITTAFIQSPAQSIMERLTATEFPTILNRNLLYYGRRRGFKM